MTDKKVGNPNHDEKGKFCASCETRKAKEIRLFTDAMNNWIDNCEEQGKNRVTREQMDDLIRANQYRNEMLAEDRAERKDPEKELRLSVYISTAIALLALAFFFFIAGMYLLPRITS